jgi:hypothetical protein
MFFCNTLETLLKHSSMTRTKTRTTRAYVWLTPEEKSEWKNKAASKGMNLNQFIRCCVERRADKFPSLSPPLIWTQPENWEKSAWISTNSLRAMNTAIASGQDIPNIEESLAVVEKVYEAVRELQTELLLGGKG